MKRAIILTLLMSLSGCASIARGTSEVVELQVEPKDAVVTTSLGFKCVSMPCKFKVDRKTEFTVTASKEGYEPQSVDVITKVSGKGAAGYAGNLIAGGVIGMGVDTATGAAKDHFPNPVIIKLVPIGATPTTPAPTVPADPKAKTAPKKTVTPVS